MEHLLYDHCCPDIKSILIGHAQKGCRIPLRWMMQKLHVYRRQTEMQAVACR